MAELSAWLNTWSAAWINAAWAIVWQSTLLALLAGLIALALRRSSPALRCWIWQLVAIKLLLMPLWTHEAALPGLAVDVAKRVGTAPAGAEPGGPLASSRTGGGQAPAATSPANVPAALEGLRGLQWQAWCFLAWLAAMALALGRLMRKRFLLGRLLGQASHAGAELLALVREAAGEAGLKETPPCFLTRTECSPFVYGLWRPALVLPADLRAALGKEELRQVLFHELAHIRRRDLLWGWPAEACRILYLFHPIAHWIHSRLRLERELACDQLAMAWSGRDPGAYATTLVKAVSHASMPPILKGVTP